MSWHWPQYVIAIITFLAFCGNVSQHGKPKKEIYDAGQFLVLTAIYFTVLYFGGFWTPAP